MELGNSHGGRSVKRDDMASVVGPQPVVVWGVPAHQPVEPAEPAQPKVDDLALCSRLPKRTGQILYVAFRYCTPMKFILV